MNFFKKQKQTAETLKKQNQSLLDQLLKETEATIKEIERRQNND